jgi:hypothetical protein
VGRFHDAHGEEAIERPAALRARNRLHAWALLTAVVLTACRSDFGASSLPRTLTDEQFWELSTGLSEPAGAFTHSDNLVSNETHFVHAIRILRSTGGAYIGVGPEQNFSYIARLRPEMAFIIDIRQENRSLHLLYKALFELSTDRADFLSRLFSRKRPENLRRTASVDDLFTAYATVSPDRRLQEANARLIRERLLEIRALPLSSDDVEWIEYALDAYYSDGPDIHYGRSRPKDTPGPSYRALMTATDIAGLNRSYLASDEGFAFVKDLHSRNLIVPIVGDFAGPDAIRRTGDYLRQHHAIVNAFYGSNVEVYLNRERTRAFCGNLATLPHDSRSWFIGNKEVRPFVSKLKACPPGPGRQG